MHPAPVGLRAGARPVRSIAPGPARTQTAAIRLGLRKHSARPRSPPTFPRWPDSPVHAVFSPWLRIQSGKEGNSPAPASQQQAARFCPERTPPNDAALQVSQPALFVRRLFALQDLAARSATPT